MALIDDLQLKIRSYKTNIKPLVKYITKSNNDIVTIDRGWETDTYKATVVYNYHDTNIKDIRNYLRTNLELNFTQLPINIFGEHINHSDINVVVGKIKDIKSSFKGVSEISVDYYLANPFTLNDFDSGLPDLKCIKGEWTLSTKENYTVLMTYNNYFYIKDSKLDIDIFKGSYTLHNDELGQLLKFWLFNNRNTKFIIQDGDFGVSNMFGDGMNQHTVFIKDIKFEPLSFNLYKVNIDLQKVE